MEEYWLRRDGLPALTFTGEVVLERSNRWGGCREQTRWHEVYVYRTAGGRWVLNVVYRTLWHGEVDSHKVRVADDPDGLRRGIEDLVPEDLRSDVFDALRIEDRVE